MTISFPGLLSQETQWYHLSPENDGVPGTAVKKLYDELLQERKPKKRIIVAVLDAGMDINHKDFQGLIWRNKDEIPDNNLDDDNNGYIDDIHGWNFLGNKNGENLETDTWELTRLYVKLQKEFEGKDTLRLRAKDKKKYDYFKEIESRFIQTRAEVKESYDTWSAFKVQYDLALADVRKYTKESKISQELLNSLEIRDDTIAGKSLNYLVQCFSQGFDIKTVDLIYNSFRIRYEFKLNPDYDSRHIVGDNPDDLNERYYGNADVAGPDPFHGTSMAGIIGAVRGNEFGVDGITNHIELMPVRVIPAGDERDKDVANAIRYAVDNGAQILNMSFGKDISPNRKHVLKAIRYAEKKGVLLVTGSGNDGRNIDEVPRYPNKFYSTSGQCKTWISVGAISQALDSSFVWESSNYGKKGVDLFAPGVGVLSLFPGNETLMADGTSIAAPMVSGTAALIWSCFPELEASELKEIIMSGVTYYPNIKTKIPGESDSLCYFSDISVTGGILNAYKAFLLAESRNGKKE